MPPLNSKSALTSDVWQNSSVIISNGDAQHKGNLCLANSLIYCAHWSSIIMSATSSIKIIQTVILKLTLTLCNLVSYKTAYIGVYEGQNHKYFGYCLFLIYVHLQFKSEFKEYYLASTSLNLPLVIHLCIRLSIPYTCIYVMK